ncbi:MAG: T9SS type A sorting domain-containing protein [Candidatus Delongbacteria bacterium]|nr:T9SS type A sorting domain-containing protein [Candidatus Delongbacteria bacterium]
MKLIYFLHIFIFASILFSEIINHNPDPNGEPWISGGWVIPSDDQLEVIKAYPKLQLTRSSKNTDLPYEVNNSYKIYFRPVFTQYANECGQAAGIGYNFTYEMNYMRGENGNFNRNQYPTYYTYNFLNDGDGINGSSYFDGWEIAMRSGIPYSTDYGGMVPTSDPSMMEKIWMSGYDKYVNAMQNRVQEVVTIPVDTPEGLDILKHWLNDHGNGSAEGGVITFAAGVYGSWQTGYLPAGTECENEMVITKWHTSVNHAMTFAGYNDSIRYDYNGDGKFTNNIDITGDDIVDMRDWEIGGLLMVNSWGTGWGNYGKAWVMYNTLGYHHTEGGIWAQRTNTVKVFENYEPLLKINTEIEHNFRDKLKIYAGISTDTSSLIPEHTIEFLMYNNSGGPNPMTGDSTYINIGLDITPLLVHMESGSYAKFFLCIDEDDPDGSGNGNILSMKLEDKYGNLTAGYPDSTVINNNNTTYISTVANIYYYTPNITTSSLPDISIDEFYLFQLTARAEREPLQWDWLIDYSENVNNDPLIVEDLIELIPEHNYDNDVLPLAIPFEFPFYGNFYDSIFVCTDGYLALSEGYKFVRDDIDIVENKVIVPHAAEFMADPTLNEGTFYFMDPDHVTILWRTALRMDKDAKYNFICKLYNDGTIEFYHTDDQPVNNSWVSGISNGSSENFIISSSSNSEDPSDLQTTFIHPDHPFGLILNDQGLLSGILSNDLERSWDLEFKITDWNGFSSTKILSLFTSSGITGNEHQAVDNLHLEQNYPNPFNPTTNIRFTLKNDDIITLKVYNLKGELVTSLIDNKLLKKGEHSISWDPQLDLSSGIYFYKITSDGGHKMIKKMTMIK